MGLKLGAAQYTYLWQLPLEDSIRRLAELGFRWLEIMTAPPHFWPGEIGRKDVASVRKLLDSLGLSLVSVNPTYVDLNMASPNKGLRKECVRQMKEQLRLARDLGAEMLVVVPGKCHPLLRAPFERIWGEWGRESLAQCLEAAEHLGVTLALENVPMFYVDRADVLMRVIEEFGSERLKVAFDVANAVMVETVPEALSKVKDDLALVHLSDTDRTPWSHLPVAKGCIDFEEIARELTAIQFGGISILEVIYPLDSDGAMGGSAERLEALGWSR